MGPVTGFVEWIRLVPLEQEASVRVVLISVLLLILGLVVATMAGLFPESALLTVMAVTVLIALFAVPVAMLVVSYQKGHIWAAIIGGLLVAFAVAMTVGIAIAASAEPTAGDAIVAVPFVLLIALPALLFGAARKAKQNSSWDRRHPRPSASDSTEAPGPPS